jgi:hypothetical protein
MQRELQSLGHLVTNDVSSEGKEFLVPMFIGHTQWCQMKREAM